jgi:hypothetical protein
MASPVDDGSMAVPLVTPSAESSSGIDPASKDVPAPLEPDADSLYIRIKHHPLSGQPDTIVPLDGVALPDTSAAAIPSASYAEDQIGRPWAPFRTLADFEAAYICVTGRLSDDLTTHLLNDSRNWSNGESYLTLRSPSDLDKVMEKARRHVPPVSE